MKMQRHYYISPDMDDLVRIEEQLEGAGIPTPQIHVLTLDDTRAENHQRLHDVQSLMKRDLIHSGEYGLLIGVCIAAAVLSLAYAFEWYTSPAGWIPFIFLAIVCLGFFTWEGGLWGIQNLNTRFRRFQDELEGGKHVFFVDLRPDQEQIFSGVVGAYPSLQAAGTGAASPHWLVVWQMRLKKLFGETLP
jgi:hypothetical protein